MTHRTDHSLVARDLDELKTRLSTTEAKVYYFVLIVPPGPGLRLYETIR